MHSRTIPNPHRRNRGLSRRSLFVALLVLTGASLTRAATIEPSSRPNIVVILVDDMGWSDIGCYGSEIPTPNLDALARGGLRFTQFYNTGRCSPTRASLMTGLYPHQAGMGHLDNLVRPNSTGTTGRLSDRCVTLGEVLREAGYFTAVTGKWHLGHEHGTPPWERGFMRNLTLRAGGVYWAEQRGKANQPLYLNGREMPRNAPEFGNDWYGPYLWTKWGLKFIDEALAERKPFFLYLAHCSPHFPLMAPQEDIARYRGKYRSGWDVLREARYRRQIEMGLIRPEWTLSERPPDVPAWDRLSAAEQDRYDHLMAIYAAMIDTMDRSVGRMVDGLRDRGVLDNTLLVFLSDNGGNAESGPKGRSEGDLLGGPDSNVFLGMCWATLNNTPFRRYKHFTHEGGISAPCILHWPDGMNLPSESPALRPTPQGIVTDTPAHLVDVMATAVDVAAASYPTEFRGHAILPMEGVSLRPLFHGQAVARPNPIFFEHEGNRAIRSGDWKLVQKHRGPWELYNLAEDRTEQVDLAASQPKRAAALRTQWRAWADRAFVDPWPGPARTDWGAVPAKPKQEARQAETESTPGRDPD